MRKILVLLGLVTAVAVPTAALAATLDTSKFEHYLDAGTKCKDEGYDGADYHFVLNQVSGSYLQGVRLTTTFVGGTQNPANPIAPSAINQKMQHFYVFSDGTLTGAHTGDGVDPGDRARLVISGVECK